MFKILCLLVLVTLLPSCKETAFKEDKVFAGNVKVSKDKLNLGKNTFEKYCISCHGANGDGKGIASKGLIPPARDFTKGIYKFGRVASGGLPHDEDFFRVIKVGLKGTAMLKWDISDERTDAVIQYIKTFAPTVWEGGDKTLGEKIVPSSDPFSSNVEQGIERGKEVYHIVGTCTTCHRAYVSHDELNQLSQKINKTPITDFDQRMYEIKVMDSEYGYKPTPPDFTWHFIRSADSVEEIFVRIAAGVGGTAMPGWKGILSDDDLWAVSHYVKYLTTLKDTPARNELMKRIEK